MKAKVLFGVRNDGPDAYFRAAAPASVLRYRGWTAEVRAPVLGRDVEEFDVLILQRHANPIAELVMREFQAADKVVIYDTDDWLRGLPPSWPCYGDFFNRGSGRPKAALEYHERMLMMADAVTCPTEALAEKVREYNPNVYILPNCVLMGDWDCLVSGEAKLDGPVVGWFGTFNHWDTWREIAGSVDEALSVFDKAYLAILGFPEVVDVFPRRLAERTMVQPRVRFRSFREMRRLITAFDVGIAWLGDSEFNRCKSPLKALQYGAAGVPIVTSRTVYGALWGYGKNNPADIIVTSYGILVERPKGLIEAIRMALGQPERMAKNSKTWQQRVWERHCYETQIGRWIEVIEEVVCQKK